jgi:hypothetical protein
MAFRADPPATVAIGSQGEPVTVASLRHCGGVCAWPIIGRMGVIQRIGWSAVMGCSLAWQTGLAAEEAAPQRELLQPPTHAVPSPITDRLALRGIYYGQKLSTAVRYDNSAGVPGTLLDAESQLGVPDTLDQGAVDFMFRMLDRHRIRVDYAQQVRNGDVVTATPIRFGNAVYPANERVLTHMDLRRFGITYTYSVVRSEKVEIGAGLGINLLQVEGTLEAPARFLREQEDAAGPFPALAVDGSWRVTKRFSVNAAFQYLGQSIDEVSGNYKSWSADVQFRAFRNLSIGAGYAATRYRITSTDDELAGYFKLKYEGPQLFLRVSY